MLLKETAESPTVSTVISNTRTTLEMIKIEHTLFALPFALLGAVLGANGLPTLKQFFWIVVAMVGARSAAMAFNRIADRRIDARNPRTSMRALPAGLLSVGFVWIFTLVAAALFLLAAAMLNNLTLILAPVALGSVLLYSFTKRWTQFSHIVLGWCLSIAPTGAWIAVRGEIGSPVPLLLSLPPPQPAAIRASAPTAARSAPNDARFFTLPPLSPLVVENHGVGLE